jgi:hypothetical protein
MFSFAARMTSIYTFGHMSFGLPSSTPIRGCIFSSLYLAVGPYGARCWLRLLRDAEMLFQYMQQRGQIARGAESSIKPIDDAKRQSRR